MSSSTLLTDIHDGSDLWTIVVRVLRKWNVYQKSDPNELCCVSLLLVDAQGTKIQASVLIKSMHNRFCEFIKEGNIYEFKNFVVSSNNFKYRPTTHPYKLTFTTHTSIMEKHAILPLFSYSFKSIAEILSLPDDEDITHLFDVLAFVKCIGSLEEQQKDNKTKHWLRMILSDVEENEIECVLFDNCASDAYIAQLENNDTPVVVLLNLAKLGWTEDKNRQLSNSFTVTRVYFNPAMKEVEDLIQSAKDRSSPLLTIPTQSMPTQTSHISGNGSLHTQNKLDIANIGDQPSGTTFVLNCEIVKFESKYGWSYNGCTKCSVKAKHKDENNPNSPLFCPACKSPTNSSDRQSFEPKMKLHYIVKDESGSTSVIFWDKLAMQLMDTTASQLKLTLPEGKRNDGFPKSLDNPIGKKLLLKLKINDYNKKFPGSSISAVEFTVCEDLISQFDAVSAEEVGLTMLEPDQDNRFASQACKETNDVVNELVVPASNHIAQDTIDVDDDTLPNITEHVTQPAIKGKRRSYTKRGGTKEHSANHSQLLANPSQDGRLTKILKQEK